MIRGFTASNQDVSFGGLYGVAPTFAVGVNAAERVEVLKGPNALLAGMQPTGSVGGSIDIIPKRAHSVPTTDLTATYVSETQFGGSFANAGERLAPFVSEQYEAGIKVDRGRLLTTLNAFQITQPSGSAPSSTGVFGEDGERRNRGIALSAFGEVTDDIRILGGVSLLDATLTKTANGINDGTRRAGSTGHL